MKKNYFSRFSKKYEKIGAISATVLMTSLPIFVEPFEPMMEATSPSWSVVGGVGVGANPYWIAIGGHYAYVTNNYDGTVSIIDITNPASPTVTATVAVGPTPLGVAVSGQYVYVANNQPDPAFISVIDTALIPPSVIVTITITSGLSGAGPFNIAISGNYAYVTNNNDNSVSVIDITHPLSSTVVATVPVGGFPRGIAISDDQAYVVNSGTGSVSIIDITDPLSASVVETVTLAFGSLPFGIAISDHYAYVTDPANSDVSIIDIALAPPSVIATVGVGLSPQGIAIGDGYAYVANNISGNVSIIDTTTNLFVATVSVGTNPVGVATSGNYIYVVNNMDRSVSIIELVSPSPPPPPPPPPSPSSTVLPPIGVSGVRVTNEFPFQKEQVNTISWSPSPTLGVTSYHVYRNGEIIGSVSAGSSLVYNDQRINSKVTYTYGVSAVKEGAESTVITVLVP